MGSRPDRPTYEDIEEQRSRASTIMLDNVRGHEPGSTYEEGVKAALAWVLGGRDKPPCEW